MNQAVLAPDACSFVPYQVGESVTEQRIVKQDIPRLPP
jgi:hypothetical protein